MSDKTKSSKTNKKRLFLWAFLLSFGISALLFSIPRVAIYEWELSDIWTRQAYADNVSDQVAVVGIDNDLFAVHKYEWPLDKNVYAELIYFLQEMGARVITFDLEFSSSLKNCGSSDELFLGMVNTSPEVVMGYGFIVQEKTSGKPASDGSADNVRNKRRSDNIISQINTKFSIDTGRIEMPGLEITSALVPYKELNANMQNCGFFNRAVQMLDGIDRWMPIMMEQDSLIYPSLSLSSVLYYLGEGAKFDSEKNIIAIGDRHLNVTNEAHLALNFKDSIPAFPMSDIVLSAQDYFKGGNPEIGKEQLNGKIVFIGKTAQSEGDLGINPVSSLNDGGTDYGSVTPMVMLHAYAANTLLENNEIHYLGRLASLLLSLISALLILFSFSKVRKSILYSVLPLFFILIYLLGALLFKENIFLPIVEALTTSILFSAAGIFINYYDNNSEYRYISSVFRTYISPELIDEMARTHTIPKLGGELIQGTAFFTDIEKFSTFSEIFTPEELIHVLNEYFSEMTEILKENRGTLDKFIGDAIVAIFGAPYYFEDNAIKACEAAWEMQITLAKLRARWREVPELRGRVDNMRMRIGINSGEFIVGHLGCEDRMNYTMIGDSVNLAARLESGAKMYGVYTMVGQSTYNLSKSNFLFRCVDRIVVMGRRESVSVYELLAPLDQVTEEIQLCYDEYTAAIEHYFAGRFEQALSLFLDSKEYKDNSGKVTPTSVMIERCEMLIEDRPDQWDGVYTMQSK